MQYRRYHHNRRTLIEKHVFTFVLLVSLGFFLFLIIDRTVLHLGSLSKFYNSTYKIEEASNILIAHMIPLILFSSLSTIHATLKYEFEVRHWTFLQASTTIVIYLIVLLDLILSVVQELTDIQDKAVKRNLVRTAPYLFSLDCCFIFSSFPLFECRQYLLF